MPWKLLIGTALMRVHAQVDLRLHLAGPPPLGRDILLGVLYSTSSYSGGEVLHHPFSQVSCHVNIESTIKTSNFKVQMTNLQVK
jgi:hypothetical protein